MDAVDELGLCHAAALAIEEQRNEYCNDDDDRGHDYDDCIASDAEDECGVNVLMTRVLASRTHIVRLTDGDIHVCSHACTQGEPGLDAHGRPNGDTVCKYTGRLLHRVAEPRTDASTGRCMSCGDHTKDGGDVGLPRHRASSRGDARRASANAFLAARVMQDDESVAMPLSAEPKARTTPRRRVANKSTSEHGEHQRFAETTFSALVSTYNEHIARSKSRCINTDNVYVDYASLLRIALRDYFETVKAKSKEATQSDVSRIVQKVRCACDTLATQHAHNNNMRLLKSLELRQAMTNLVMSIFACVCKTPYNASATDATLAFRSVCAGVFYALKRGVVLPTGPTIVPKVSAFATVLQIHRAHSQSTRLKSLHAQSHRGLCILHRAVASVPRAQQDFVFADAIHAAQKVRRVCAC